MMRKNKPPAVAARNDLPSADEDVARLRFELSHCSIEELEEAGLVIRDSERGIVKKGPKFHDEKPGASGY